jgi:hypothetical protein
MQFIAFVKNLLEFSVLSLLLNRSDNNKWTLSGIRNHNTQKQGGFIGI